ncbi:MAG: DNA mismatch repair endonuclease MutL [Sumerlaeia bacterium]
MATIRVLPQQLINQIAAGEVVVNMASVVKELVENSIDAGATSIRLSLSQSLQDLTIEDDGCGMTEEDAELCLQRHATSKIQSTQDLFALQTRGFRGEAIPSIASVSKMEILTRPKANPAGTRVVVAGGEISLIKPKGCPAGTRISIQDLFFNTPARRKFLKSGVSEMNLIMKTVVRQALASPDVGIRVERGDKLMLELPARQTLADRFLSLQGSRIEHGLLPLDFCRISVPKAEGDVEHRGPEANHTVRVTGYLAHPHSSRGDRSAQYLFVNGRPFSQKQITAGIEQACRGFIMIGRFPVYCVFIEVSPSEVDFNVHPTKEEVRFRDERAIAGAAYHAVRNVLETRETVPQVHLEGTSVPQETPESEKFEESPRALIERARERRNDSNVQRVGMQSDLTLELMKQKKPWWLDYDSSAEEKNLHQPKVEQSARRSVSPSVLDASQAIPEGGESLRALKPYAGVGEKADPHFWERPYEAEPLGQLALTFVIVRFGPDLLIVDQHAAHERLRFIELQRRQNTPESQTLLVPETFQVSAEQASLLKSLQQNFQQQGFGLEHFGGQTWVINSVPADLQRFDSVAVVLDVLDDLQEHGRSNRIENLRDQLLIRMACHSSIRAGHELSVQEMRALLELMQRYQLSFTCPHGRPTIIQLTLEELEKRFGRMGA